MPSDVTPETSQSLSRFAVQPAWAITLACLVAVWAAFTAAHSPGVNTDVDQLWYAARALINGANPYTSIGPGSPVPHPYPLMYPLPAVLVIMPFAFLPIEALRASLAAASGGLLTYCIARTDARGLVLLFSRSLYLNVTLVNWTPLLMLMWWWPKASALAAVKPTVGIAMLAGVKNYREAIPGLLIAAAATALCFIVRPTWLAEWLDATSKSPSTRPWILTPWAFVVLFALAFPNRWQSRFLVMFMLVPQTLHPIAVLPLILLPVSLVGKTLIAFSTYLPVIIINREPFGSRVHSHVDMHAMLGSIILWTVIVPTLCFVLWDGYREWRRRVRRLER